MTRAKVDLGYDREPRILETAQSRGESRVCCRPQLSTFVPLQLPGVGQGPYPGLSDLPALWS